MPDSGIVAENKKVTTVTNKVPAWWSKKSHADQIKYIKSHPNTRLKPTKQKQKRVKTTSAPKAKVKKTTLTQRIQRALEPAKNVSANVVKFIDLNAKKISNRISKTLDNVSKGLKASVSRIPSAAKVNIGKRIRAAITSPTAELTVKAAAITLGRLGLLTVGLLAGVAIGAPIPLSMLLLYHHRRDVWHGMSKLPLDSLITTFVGKIFDGVREGSKDKKKLRESVVEDEEPDIPVSSHDIPERASAISMNVTEAIKDFQAVECKNYASDIRNCCDVSHDWLKANGLVDLLYSLDDDRYRCAALHARFATDDSTKNYMCRVEKCMEKINKARNEVVCILNKLANGPFHPALQRLGKALLSNLGSKTQMVATYIKNGGYPLRVLQLQIGDKCIYIGHDTETYDPKSTLFSVMSNNTTPRQLDTVDASKSLRTIVEAIKV